MDDKANRGVVCVTPKADNFAFPDNHILAERNRYLHSLAALPDVLDAEM
jgi:hypothetical protein